MKVISIPQELISIKYLLINCVTIYNGIHALLMMWIIIIKNDMQFFVCNLIMTRKIINNN